HWRQLQAPLKRIQCRRQIERVNIAERSVGESQFVFIDIAKSKNARQDRSFTKHVDKHFSGQTTCAPRRQIKRDLREQVGGILRGKIGYEAPVHQRRDERAEKRLRWWNGEYAHDAQD